MATEDKTGTSPIILPRFNGEAPIPVYEVPDRDVETESETKSEDIGKAAEAPEETTIAAAKTDASDEKADDTAETEETPKVTVISRNDNRAQGYGMLLAEKQPEGVLSSAPSIFINDVASAKIAGYLDWSIAKSCEFSAFLEIETNSQGIWVVDVIIPKQEGTAGHSEMDEDEVGDLFVQRYQDNARPIRGWVHSHPNMSCFWSGTDDGTITRFMNHEFFLSLVFSNNLTCLSKLTLGFGLVIDKLPVFLDGVFA
jgi:hypothetical protein